MRQWLKIFFLYRIRSLSRIGFWWGGKMARRFLFDACIMTALNQDTYLTMAESRSSTKQNKRTREPRDKSRGRCRCHYKLRYTLVSYHYLHSFCHNIPMYPHSCRNVFTCNLPRDMYQCTDRRHDIILKAYPR